MSVATRAARHCENAAPAALRPYAASASAFRFFSSASLPAMNRQRLSPALACFLRRSAATVEALDSKTAAMRAFSFNASRHATKSFARFFTHTLRTFVRTSRAPCAAAANAVSAVFIRSLLDSVISI